MPAVVGNWFCNGTCVVEFRGVMRWAGLAGLVLTSCGLGGCTYPAYSYISEPCNVAAGSLPPGARQVSGPPANGTQPPGQASGLCLYAVPTYPGYAYAGAYPYGGYPAYYYYGWDYGLGYPGWVGWGGLYLGGFYGGYGHGFYGHGFHGGWGGFHGGGGFGGGGFHGGGGGGHGR